MNEEMENMLSGRARQIAEKELFSLNGFVMLLILFGAGIFVFLSLFAAFFASNASFVTRASLLFSFFGVFFLLKGLTIIKPNQSIVGTLFGNYSGSLSDEGFFWINPFLDIQRISLKSQNIITPVMKVNDGNGNPIEIAAAIVWKVSHPAKAVFDVENVVEFVAQQCESAIRGMAASHPYESNGDDEKKMSLRGHAEEVSIELRKKVQERVMIAGVSISESRISHRAYAPEIAQAMLKKQQAEAVLASRRTIVTGALGMVEDVLKELEKRNIVGLDSKEKVALVTNLMTVLVSDDGAKPVISVGNASD